MSSVNKVIILGHAGRDAEVKYLPSGKAVATVSIATSSKRKDKDTGETIEGTQWHRVQFFDRLAEIAGEYVKKGKSIYVEGRIRYGKYVDKDGIEKSSVDIIATEMQLLGGRDDGQAPRQQAAAPRQQAAPQRQAAPAQRQAPAGGFADMEDDVPW